MYCKNCGSQLDLDDSAQFCSSCGFSLAKGNHSKPVYSNKPIEVISSPTMTHETKLRDLKSYIQIIAVFEIIIGALLLVGSFLILVVRHFAIRNVSLDEMQSVNSFNFGMSILLAMGILVLLYALFVVASGIGLLKSKKWAKATSLVVGALAVFSFPLGTIFGVFTLYNLTKPETTEILIN